MAATKEDLLNQRWHTLEAMGSPWNIESDDASSVALIQQQVGDDCKQTKRTRLAQAVKALPDLLEACEAVVSGYETDGMENMKLRDDVFYRLCKTAVEKAKGGAA